MTQWILHDHTDDEADRDFVRDQLRAYNRQRLPQFFDPAVPVPQVGIYARDESGQIVGGITGEIHWTTLMIDYLWVDEALRGQGLGGELLRRAEAEAARQGCTAASLTTFDFQAPAFYQRLGYRIIGQMDDYPPGHTWFMLRREF